MVCNTTVDHRVHCLTATAADAGGHNAYSDGIPIEMLMILGAYLRSIRPRQWTKNILLFAALVFANVADNPVYVMRSVAAFLLFCVIAGAVYLFNDIMDRERDRLHPVKQHRPVASGVLSPLQAWSGALLLGTVGQVLSFRLSIWFGVTVLAYLLLQILYTLLLKRVVIIDVLGISLSFLLRVVAGAVAVNVRISDWIIVCTMLLALFLALSKRRHELTFLADDAKKHRFILDEYSTYLLDQMIGVVTAATLVAYTIYTLDPDTVAKFGRMVLTVPYVLYGIFRYLYLVHVRHRGGRPEELLLTDIPLLVNVILYGITTVIIIYVV